MADSLFIAEDKGLGRQAHFDVRNLDFPARALAIEERVEYLPPKDRKWRQWRTWYQGNDPHCTLYSELTLLSASPVTQPMRLIRLMFKRFGEPGELFRKIQAEDRAHGRVYAEGATVLAAAQVGRDLGWWSSFAWAYRTEEARQAVCHVGPGIFGTNWYRSMYERDREGIVPDIRPGERPIGGHAWCCNGYDVERDLYRDEGTWNDGVRWHRGEQIRRLLEVEDGEFMIPTETKLAPQVIPPSSLDVERLRARSTELRFPR
jgi:hypothetical protein